MNTEQMQLIEKQLNISGVKEWHNNGIKGKGIKILLTEGMTDHNQGEANMINLFAPEAEIIMGCYTQIDGIRKFNYNNISYTPEQLISEFDINIVGRSTGGTAIATDPIDSPFWNTLKDKYKLVFNNSAGNNGVGDETNNYETLTASFPADVAFYWGAVGINDSGVIKRKYYSSCGKLLKFMNFTGYLEGTSFAQPIGSAEEALLKCRYGKDMSAEEIEEYFKMVCKDLGTTGFDIYHGYGLPILPKFTRRYITMKIGSNEYSIDGVSNTMDTVPVIVNGSTYVPVSVVARALGKNVIWDSTTKRVTIGDSVKTISFVIGEYGSFINSNGRTMIPIRFIAESFGCKVSYVPKYKKVLILEG